MSPSPPAFDLSICGSIASATLCAPVVMACNPVVENSVDFVPEAVAATQPLKPAAASWRRGFDAIVNLVSGPASVHPRCAASMHRKIFGI